MALELHLWFNEDSENDFEILSRIGVDVAKQWRHINYSVEEIDA